MSTRASIVYDDKNGIHIYKELLDGNVYLELGRDGTELLVKLMSVKDWLALGLPNIARAKLPPVEGE